MIDADLYWEFQIISRPLAHSQPQPDQITQLFQRFLYSASLNQCNPNYWLTNLVFSDAVCHDVVCTNAVCKEAECPESIESCESKCPSWAIFCCCSLLLLMDDVMVFSILPAVFLWCATSFKIKGLFQAHSVWQFRDGKTYERAINARFFSSLAKSVPNFTVFCCKS